MKLAMSIEAWPFRTPFRITGHVIENADVLVVSLTQGGATGRGEAGGVFYHHETPASMAAQIESLRGDIEAGLDRHRLRNSIGPGGARNGLDCALWDLEAQLASAPAWALADLAASSPLDTTFTIGAGSPAEMANTAQTYRGARSIKLKLTPEQPGACVRAVRAARPDVWLGVDANQGFSGATLRALLPDLIDARISLIEQPVPVGADGELEGLASPIPVAADESVQGLGDIASLVGRYDVVNIKLDKCGGLTEALLMAREARRLGLKVMVGCMGGTSLAMAPAFLLGQVCDFVDLDAPTFLAADRDPPALYKNGQIWCPEALWGNPRGVASSGYGRKPPNSRPQKV